MSIIYKIVKKLICIVCLLTSFNGLKAACCYSTKSDGSPDTCTNQMVNERFCKPNASIQSIQGRLYTDQGNGVPVALTPDGKCPTCLHFPTFHNCLPGDRALGKETTRSYPVKNFPPCTN